MLRTLPASRPMSPGQILKDQFLSPLQITQKQLADHIGVDIMVINRIINNRARITAKVAVKLAYALDTAPEFWFQVQTAIDRFRVEERMGLPPESLLTHRKTA